MGRRKSNRTSEEEIAFKLARRERKAENQTRQRRNLKTNAQKDQSELNSNDIDIQSEHVPELILQHRRGAELQQNIGVVCNQAIEIRREITVQRQEIIDIQHETTRPAASLNDTGRQRRCRQRQIEERNLLSAGLITNVQEHYGGHMTEICTHCNAAHFASEKVSNMRNSFHDCCTHGKVHLEPLPVIPVELGSLFDGSHEKSNAFFKRIRNYNSLFSFASFNANLMNFEERRPGPYCFKIQGQIYYQVNTAFYPAPEELPSYGQLFIVDSNEAVDSLQRRNTALDRDLLGTLDRIMRDNNIFAQSYQMMGEELQAQRLCYVPVS